MNTGHLPVYTMTAFSRQIKALGNIWRVLTQIDRQIRMRIILLENFPHFLAPLSIQLGNQSQGMKSPYTYSTRSHPSL